MATNVFTKVFQQHSEDRFFEKLHNQVKPQAFYAKYKGFRSVVLALSYLFNVASATSAGYAVYWFTNSITGIEVISWIVAGIFLIALEAIKRRSSSEFWKAYFFQGSITIGWLLLSIGCLGLSLASSAFGVKEGTEDMGPSASLIAIDSTAQAYRDQIARLEADNLKLEKQKNHLGQIFWPAQMEKQQNKEMIADLNTRILDLDKKLEGQNDKLSVEHRRDLEITAWTLVWVTIFMELLFELCIGWIWYYNYRAYIERKKTAGLPPDDNPPSPTPPSPNGTHADIDPELVAAIVKAITSQPNGYTHNGNGHHNHSGINLNSVHDVFSSSRFKLPIGFYSRAQRDAQIIAASPSTENIKASVQACTDVYREKVIKDDLYTVIHEYKKGGKTYRTPYTRNQIIARVNQYTRELDDARKNNLTQTVIDNRQRWITYWNGKLEELDKKSA